MRTMSCPISASLDALVVLVRVVICEGMYQETVMYKARWSNLSLTWEVSGILVFYSSIDGSGNGRHAVLVATASHSARWQSRHSRGDGKEEYSDSFGEHLRHSVREVERSKWRLGRRRGGETLLYLAVARSIVLRGRRIIQEVRWIVARPVSAGSGTEELLFTEKRSTCNYAKIQAVSRPEMVTNIRMCMRWRQVSVRGLLGIKR